MFTSSLLQAFKGWRWLLSHWCLFQYWNLGIVHKEFTGAVSSHLSAPPVEILCAPITVQSIWFYQSPLSSWETWCFQVLYLDSSRDSKKSMKSLKPWNNFPNKKLHVWTRQKKLLYIFPKLLAKKQQLITTTSSERKPRDKILEVSVEFHILLQSVS